MNFLACAPRAVPLAAALSIALMTWTASPNTAVPAIAVGKNVQVSRPASTITHNEVWGDGNPANAKNLIGCSILDYPQGWGRTAAYASLDGGATWAKTLETGFGDPACTFTHDGHAIFTTIGRLVESGPERLYLIAYYSLDGGTHWTRSRFVSGDQIDDRDFVATDLWPKSPFYGGIYISGLVWARDFSGNTLGGIGLYRSADGGKTFEGPVIAIPEQSAIQYQSLNLGVLSDGTVAVLADNMLVIPPRDAPPDTSKPNGTLRLLIYRNGGRAFDRAAKIADITSDWRPTASTLQGDMTVDSGNTPFKDRIYVTWAEYAGKRDTIVLSYSSDKGKTWSVPRVVSDEGVSADAQHLPDSIMPELAVNKDGVVGITWYDRRDNPDQGYYVRFSASLDGGDDWFPSVRVSARPKTLGSPHEVYSISSQTSSNPRGPVTFEVAHSDWATGGHSAGLAADAGGVFHAFWIDNRTGVHQMWTAPITVSGVAFDQKGSLAARYTDVTPQADARWSNIAFDSHTGLMSFIVSIANTTKRTWRAPLKVFIANVRSDRGLPVFVKPASTEGGAGAVIDMSGRIHDGVVLPGQRVSLGKMAVRLFGFQRGDPAELASLLQFDLRVYVSK